MLQPLSIPRAKASRYSDTLDPSPLSGAQPLALSIYQCTKATRASSRIQTYIFIFYPCTHTHLKGHLVQTALFPGHTDGESMPCSDPQQPLLDKITDCNILGSFIFAAPSQTCLPSAVLVPKLQISPVLVEIPIDNGSISIGNYS